MEKLYKLFMEIKSKLFGKRKKENIGNTGSEASKIPSFIQEIENMLYKNGFEIKDYHDCGYYYSNGHWFKSNGKGKFIYLGRDASFEGENLKA